jgi:phosphoglycerate kinase
MQTWCERLIAGRSAAPDLTLPDYVRAIPKLDSLANVRSGTVVLVRGDVDAKPGAKIGEGDIRLRSMVETLNFGRQKGWKQVIFGHIGRDPEASLKKVAARLGELLGCEVPLVTDWLDESTTSIRDGVSKQIQSAANGSVLMLENMRRYEVERVLWKAKPADLPGLSERLARLASQFAQKLGAVYVHEAFSAGSLDASSTVVPATMEQVALGKYEAEQFIGPLMRCLDTQLLIFSGLKADKLDDLEAMIGRGRVRRVLTAGSLAMALKKATAQLDGRDFRLGVAEDERHADKPYYVAPKRIEQARRIVSDGRAAGVDFVVPIDFVIQDGSVKEELAAGDQQFDIGPKTSELFEQKVGQFIRDSGKGAVAFHNGVFGMFEDPRFEEGTRRFMAQLKRMHDAGIEVYIGGGEGGTALEKYGQESWVTHVFTAGGTVLNALGSEPVPYLVALRAAAS